MNSFDTFAAFLKGPVGNALANHPGDVLATKQNLKRAGYFADEDENGYITRSLDTGIRNFQRDNSLRIDGRLFPGGETERGLFETLTGRSANAAFGRAEAEQGGFAGFGGNVSGMVSSGTGQSPDFTPNPLYRTGGFSGRDESGKTAQVFPMSERERKQPQTNNASLGYNEKEYLDKVENVYREYVKRGKDKGLDDAANNLEHFLEGSGEQKILSREEARSRLFVRNGEDVNRKRFAASFTNKKKMGEKFLKMKDGETIDIKDNWDYEVGYLPKKSITDPSRSHILSGDLDEILSTGASFVKSGGDFKAKRQGNTIFIDGFVTHSWEDRYDFNSMGSGGAGAIALEKAGRSKSFDIKSKWKQRVKGTLKIENGKVMNHQLEWEDINFNKGR